MVLSILRNRIVIGIGLLLVVAVAGRIVWSKFGNLVERDPRFQLSHENIHVNAPPDWIHSDVKRSAIQIGQLDQLSLLDRELVAKVQEAFQVQTWVAEVESVRKTPTRVDIKLRYRKPVAMVEISADGVPKLQPVDEEGVLLPGIEFSEAQTHDFIRIAIINPRMNGLIDGTAWPDERIVQAAAVASVLAKHRKTLSLFRINLMQTHHLDPEQRVPVFELQTNYNDRIVWGSAPGVERTGEMDVSTRLSTLMALKHALTDKEEAEAISRYDIRSGTAIRLTRSVSQTETFDHPRTSPFSGDPWGTESD